jgi:ABC-type uncharacterized transport system auxiliary subunit
MVDYLRAAGLAREVVTASAGASPDWILRGRINRLEHVPAGTGERAIVELEIRVAKPRSASTLLAGTYRAERSANSGGLEATVRAFSAALTELLAELSRDLQNAE